MQLEINNHDDTIVEWIPYDHFSNIKEIGRGGFSTVYSAIWTYGLIHYDSTQGWIRKSNTRVALKCLYNSQNITNEFSNEV
jgi:serine/threonine protein kinase